MRYRHFSPNETAGRPWRSPNTGAHGQGVRSDRDLVDMFRDTVAEIRSTTPPSAFRRFTALLAGTDSRLQHFVWDCVKSCAWSTGAGCALRYGRELGIPYSFFGVVQLFVTAVDCGLPLSHVYIVFFMRAYAVLVCSAIRLCFAVGMVASGTILLSLVPCTRQFCAWQFFATLLLS